ncbi:Eco29kI family restriction endonuclease [Mycobacterium sp. M1]|uniref:Eco29kI family restriction endonuclease n=1 Tax=Mycolicibacter acidiphilus TaxID=2835306 RepID=A0ABS5RLB3_9MYCO|nr:Eco29kI family restriction endonuclease [Mycolicibacter acidiphilus]MBS9535097.1 Eco29kI family restriction endonuclease [Mycolicibacter acidiphilus]
MSGPFNPLDMENLAVSTANALLTTDPTPLGGVPQFYGAGVYAIYYGGTLPMYSLLTTATVYDTAVPIYVGKAVPKGGRKGVAVEHGTKSRALSGRLGEHARSVTQATNLDIADFTCRWLVVEPIWIPLGESVVISRFAPVWNVMVDGFGNHDPGAGRRAGVRSRWDTLHPGRPWAPLFPERPESADDIAADVTEYLVQRYQV